MRARHGRNLHELGASYRQGCLHPQQAQYQLRSFGLLSFQRSLAASHRKELSVQIHCQGCDWEDYCILLATPLHFTMALSEEYCRISLLTAISTHVDGPITHYINRWVLGMLQPGNRVVCVVYMRTIVQLDSFTYPSTMLIIYM
jgi:hypothetical protein